MRRSICVLTIVAACVAAPTTVPAATPFTAGSGAAPTVAVGSDGTGHIAWETTEDDAKVGYCRVSAGASACNRTELLPFPGAENAQRAGNKARVFAPAPNKVVIVAGCWNCGGGVEDRTYRWTSENNGTSFVGPVLIGTGPETNGFGAWLDELNLFVGASGSHVKAAAIDGKDGVQYATGGIFVYGPEVARVPSQPKKLVAATNDLDVVKYGVYVGDSLVVGSINSDIGWQIDKTLPGAEPDNSDTALNSGPNGVLLTYRYFVANDSHIGLRRFDPVTNVFGAPLYLEGPDPIENNSLDEPDSFQDAAGRIHVVWDTLFGGGRLRYTVSDPAGTTFTTAATLAKAEGFYEPEIAAGADGQGFVAWTPGSTGSIRVVPIAPEAESGVIPPKPDTTSPKATGFKADDTTLFPGEGVKFSFNASEAGLAVLTFEKQFKGLKGKRKGKKACLPRSKKRLRALRKKADSEAAYRKLLKKLSCRAYKRIGEIRQAVKAGRNTIEFSGRIAGRPLSPGRYRASLVITDSAGNVSRTETVNFKVLSKKAKRKPRR
jgi:hypothetical protein